MGWWQRPTSAGRGSRCLLLEKLPRLGGATSSQEVFRGVSARLSRYSYLISLLPPKVMNDLGLHLDLRRRRIAACAPYDRDGKHRALLLSNERPRAGPRVAGRAGRRVHSARARALRSTSSDEYARLVHPSADRAAALAVGLEGVARDRRPARGVGQLRRDTRSVRGSRRLIDDDLVRGLILTDAKTGMFTDAHDPRLTQNRIFTYHGTGTWSVPVGGMGSLVSELTRVASEAGVVALTDATVERIHPGNDRHTVEVSLGGHPMEIEAQVGARQLRPADARSDARSPPSPLGRGRGRGRQGQHAAAAAAAAEKRGRSRRMRSPARFGSTSGTPRWRQLTRNSPPARFRQSLRPRSTATRSPTRRS